MTPRIVPDDTGARVTASGPIRHLCPHVDEVDDGTVEIAWTCVGSTVELHSLAAHLLSFKDTRASHEAVTRRVQRDVAALSGVDCVAVTSTWHTAGLEVRVEARP